MVVTLDQYLLKNQIQTSQLYMLCPLCGAHITHSYYLRKVFERDNFAYWAACLVTHYRHNHIKYYDRTWRSSSYSSKNPAYKHLGYEEFKKLVNNRAKRQIIRGIVKHAKFPPREKRFLIDGFSRLQFNDAMTTVLIQNSIKKIDLK